MASTTLYAPTVNTYLPAFVAGSSCRFYFSLSKYSSVSPSSIVQIHLSVVKQSNGQSVVNRVDNKDGGRYRSSGIIIINTAPTPVTDKKNLYYVDILNEDITSGWQAGWIYKVQMRLSTITYDGGMGQSAWLNINAGNFSEWSTYCTIKAIGKSKITIPILKNFDSEVDVNIKNKIFNLNISTLKFEGTYSNEDISETLYSYRVQLLDTDDSLLEDSDILYTNQYYTPNQFYYLFKTELKNNHRYGLYLTYTTLNKYEESYLFNIYTSQAYVEDIIVYAATIDNVDLTKDQSFIKKFKESTSKVLEEDEGKIVIKLYSEKIQPVMTNICIRRADSKDNFQTWSDIKIINCINQTINELPIFEDFTIESGVWYKYGVQTIDTSGYRSLLYVFDEDEEPTSLREFEYSFLLGADNKQLKLKYNNNMSNYTYNYSESKADTLGGEYPFITRNGATKYRSFPVTGLLSYTMDENEQFTNDEELYKYDDIIDKYKNRRIEERFGIYDYKKEFDFREEALKFLYDGKPKLFKSSTEGNIIVRLMQVAAQPSQPLNRMIFAFTSTAYEIAEATIENYDKYGFLDIGDYLTSFKESEPFVGEMIFDAGFPVGENLIQKIWDKYDYSEQDMAGYKIILNDIRHLTLIFEQSFPVKNNIDVDIPAGNNFVYNGNTFTVVKPNPLDPSPIEYVFDENIYLKSNDKILIEGDAGGTVDRVPMRVIFIGDRVKEPADKRRVDSRDVIKNVGQAYGMYNAGTDIYIDVAQKYYYDWSDSAGYIYRFTGVCIEGEKNLVFEITDRNVTSRCMIGETGILNFDDYDNNIKSLKYLGKSTVDGSTEDKDIEPIRSHISVEYLYYMIKITYSV